ncbi:MAG: DeoR/GlpR family DNA-binding transcription regulator, partial [Oscillospiraceae bacterium]
QEEKSASREGGSFIGDRMLKESRCKQIVELLKRDGEVEINSLCRMFGVADMTIRRDLNRLAQDNNILRTHGGAILLQEDQITEPSYERRINDAGELKMSIAKKAMSYIKTGERIYLDSGSTTYYIAKQFPNAARNVIVTNAINVASEIISRSNINVVLVGGDLRGNTHSTRGALAMDILSRFKVDVAFLGANAIDENGDIYVANTTEVGMKNTAIQAAKLVYVLVDHTKIYSDSLLKYTNMADIAGVITDYAVSEEIVDNFRQKGLNLIVAER